MKSKTLFVLLVMSLIAALAVPAAFGEDVALSSNTIVDVAVANGSFTTLVAAVQAADLAGALSAGSWTVFAPTDDAFAKLGLNAGNIAEAFTVEELTDILLYHAIPGVINSEKALSLVGDVTMANGQRAGLKFFAGDLYMNDDSKIIIPDVYASNGIIHVVDTVILGPWPRTDDAGQPSETSSAAAVATGNTIVDIAVANGSFTTLVAAVQAAGLAEALSGGAWTVFAPTDDAFAKLGLDAGNIAEAFTVEELTDILLYHAIAGRVDAATAVTLVGDVTMANGQIAGLKVFQGNLYVNDDSKVIAADIFASNGVIHVVDTVILGPWPK
jgi:transforming growth factor-beta-induced protein